ncbi:Transmembrane exosortase (Exosortase_EpsH) [Lacunisphaera limnophila]|uniref:Transmembrane exosortase (Exosortase_EpsH) n=1 Tax=Lacunisphaera limnophila TaxID=1838286 RepID=A0A1D8AX24_9BACT|nr:exosortase/archaeosortase family protein [Lacunisphaera limnophila]AOS45438.1 Transmembrane exosortase (Exosortase_EpsH) [Lacunisphaera limnophila]
MTSAALPAPPAARVRLPAGILVMLAALGASVIAYSLHLWPEWSRNPDLSHGFFAPLIFLLLLWESRKQGPWRWLPARPWALGLLTLTVTAGLALVGLAGLFAATLAWNHAVVLFLLAAALSALLGAGLLVLADERVRLLPLNWISVTALLLWPMVAPIPDGTYARLTFSLQSWVTGAVMDALQILGIPARQHGNIIELARTTVGVEEACSGVRSLISCIYAGFFFAAWQVRRPARRLLLIIAAPALALGMNLLRSLTLTLLANHGTDISGTWHDATGFAILGVTAAILAGLAVLLESRDPPETPPADRPITLPLGALRVFWTGAALVLGLGGFFYLNSRSITTIQVPESVPFARLLPAEAAGWQVVTPDDLYRFSDILRTDYLSERTYLRTTESGGNTQLTVYVAYWPAGQTSVSQVASHTPDACWPGAGWSSITAGSDRRQVITQPGMQLSPAEYRLFKTDRGSTQHVWFWHLFDGRVIDYRDPYSLSALLQIALKYGFSRQGSQYFVRISSNRPWSELADEPLLREILTNLDQVGL